MRGLAIGSRIEVEADGEWWNAEVVGLTSEEVQIHFEGGNDPPAVRSLAAGPPAARLGVSRNGLPVASWFGYPISPLLCAWAPVVSSAVGQHRRGAGHLTMCFTPPPGTEDENEWIFLDSQRLRAPQVRARLAPSLPSPAPPSSPAHPPKTSAALVSAQVGGRTAEVWACPDETTRPGPAG